MVKIYTKSGDRGKTSLFGGQKVEKDNLRIETYGSVDELNSLIGIITSDLRHPRSNRGSDVRLFESEDSSESERPKDSILSDPRIREDDRGLEAIAIKLNRIQAELFVLGSDLATPLNVSTSSRKVGLRGASKIPRITKAFIARLEKEIDTWQKQLPQLEKFILPGGSKIGAKLHLARTIARRAERSIVRLGSQEKINKRDLIYVNRLSDWFFVAARYINKLEKIKETEWKGRG